jgi:hypothetical protein
VRKIDQNPQIGADKKAPAYRHHVRLGMMRSVQIDAALNGLK